jgi:acyl-coenzyme A synthetase/AMP-(fatty) acid ligase
MPLSGLSVSSPSDLADILDIGLSMDPNRVALLSEGRLFTWQQLTDTSSRLASGYLKIGLEPGDRIASLMPNRPEVVIHYLACLKAGLVATPLNYRYTPPEIDHALEVSGALLLVHHHERSQDVAACRLRHCLTKGVVQYGSAVGCGYESLLAQGDPHAKFATHSSDTPAFIFFTSGSTGLPKGVTHTRDTVGWIVASIISAFRLTLCDVVLPGSSFSHMAASMFGLASLSAGAQLAVAYGNHPEELLPLIRTARPTVMFMLPAAMAMLVRDHDAARGDFSSIKACFTGGDKLSIEIENEFTELVGRPISEGYGMTEIGHAATLPLDATFRPGSLGKACPGYEFSIRNDVGDELPAGKEGRVWVRFPGNTVGYWNNPEATAATIVDGWLDTGDVMIVDDDGYLWFHGRKKQIIVHDGSNICPEDVEAAVATHPAVESVGVVGVHDLIHGENVRAYVTLKPGLPRPTASEIIQLARQRVGYKAPEEIEFLSQMPMCATGKIDRSTLKLMAEERISG